MRYHMLICKLNKADGLWKVAKLSVLATAIESELFEQVTD